VTRYSNCSEYFAFVGFSEHGVEPVIVADMRRSQIKFPHIEISILKVNNHKHFLYNELITNTI
jgi:hypothetical protein